MNVLKSALLAVALLLVGQGFNQALGQESVPDRARVALASQPKGAFPDTRAIGVGLVIIGAALGIGGVGRSAVESIARQPEMAGNIQTAMIIVAALIEGVAFFALIIIMLFVPPY